MMKHSRFLTLCVSACLAASLNGCFGQQQEDSTAQEEESPKTEQTVDTQTDTGQQEQGESDETLVPDTTVVLTNETGYDITTLSLRASGSGTYEDAYTFQDLNYANGTSQEFSFKKLVDGDEPVQLYDIRLVTTDEGIIEMLNVDLLGLSDLTLHFEGGIGYVGFVNQETNEVLDNREEAEQAEADNVEQIVTYDQQEQLG